jgi:hypothetical protein
MPTEFSGQYHEFISTDDSALAPGTLAEPRPADRYREIPAPGEPTGPFFHEIVDKGPNLPPGTMASPRPPGRERLLEEDSTRPPADAGEQK